ncbi:MAG TPA: phosphoribosylanthranilate isomerase [Acetobacteraceae bacterium]|nr:phosphoribosylanthranilate isomerase [Acetobacteraceae bacterium]
MMVKICGITNRDDAQAAIDGGAAALGFNFYPASPRYISPDAAAAIIAALPGNVWKVGVFVDETPEAVTRTARQTGLDIAQLHGRESPAEYPPDMRVWKALRVRDGIVPQSLDCPAEAVLLDGPASGEAFDWARAPHGVPKLILAGGLDAGNVRQAIEQVRPWGVDACSRLEVSPGRKDHLKMTAFLKAALAAA